MLEPVVEIPRLKQKSAGKKSSDFSAEWPDFGILPEKARRFLESVFLLSPFLEDCARKEQEFTLELFELGFEVPCSQLIENAGSLGIAERSEAELMQGLRVAKRRMALLCGLADLGGWWRDGEVTKALSDFAGACVSAALGHILLSQHHAGRFSLVDPANPENGCGLVVLGMGKLGAGELREAQTEPRVERVDLCRNRPSLAHLPDKVFHPIGYR